VLGPLPPRDGAETAAVLYTSGTTSRPKGVEITHANYVWAAELMARNTALTERDRHAIACPFFHINAQTYSLLPALLAGADVLLMERFSKSRWWDAVRTHGATVASLVTSMIRMFMAAGPAAREGEHSLRLVGCGAVTPAFEERFGVRTIGWFGMTETITTPIVTSLNDPGRGGAIGFPSPGYALRLLDDEGRECEAGELGELWVQGAPGVSLMKGYLKDPEATARTVQDGWLRTGDNLRRDEDGYLFYVNRAKDMIKRGGENVAAGEVERVLMSHPKVYEAAVIAVPDPILDEAVKAFVIPRDEAEPPSPEELIAHCRERLAAFKIPSEVELRAELPRSTLDKVAKKVLIAEERARRRPA
ncbi:MAG: AMP-binding protein, partial [Candidatus Methylomirabilis sp.]|nr:AMP-binding protein [Deltaproteobacteria bacterium]